MSVPSLAVRHEIKGSAFVTLRQWMLTQMGTAAFRQLVRAMPATHRSAVEEPLASAWHPEEVHRDVLRGLLATCEGDFERYQDAIAGATQLGIHKFARLVLQMSSASFVLRRSPAMWRIIRRGPATLHVEQNDRRTVVNYRDFPFFEDLLYRKYITALLGAIVNTSAGYVPEVEIIDGSANSVAVAVTLRRRT